MAFLAAVAVIEYGLFFCYAPQRPSADDRFDGHFTGGAFDNAVGQSGVVLHVYAALVLSTLYAIRFLRSVGGSRGTATAIYFVAVLMSLPVIWLLVSPDWNNGHAEQAIWCDVPVGLLTVPSLGYLADVWDAPRRKPVQLVVELASIVPWYVAWKVAELVLGFYWI